MMLLVVCTLNRTAPNLLLGVNAKHFVMISSTAPVTITVRASAGKVG